ncbi:MAG: type II toxin-antitoxin system VapC family toxin [Planctomycetaceae bacterium]|nr:type II toxin-antitoxin system VapC family toxin [Planctomycetaceae bacterium]
MAVLETTFVIDLMKESKRGRSGPAALKLQELAARGEPLRIAIFTLGELYVGVAKGTRPRQERAAIEQCVAPFEVLPFEQSTAEIFGTIVGELEKRGESISDIDALIASVALEHSEVLVTRNRKHFDRISGLAVESY